MGDIASVYESVRHDLSALAADASGDELHRDVPATPGWRVRDVIAHLAGDAGSLIAGDMPRPFFESLGDDAGLEALNAWTRGHVEERAERSIDEILREWEVSATDLVAMMRQETPWPDGVPAFADRAIVTDMGVHQHDIYGAFGIARARDAAPVRIGSAGYVAWMDARLRMAAGPGLRIVSGDKVWTVGGDEPSATLQVDRFELFRALSGRRSPEQVRAYDWDGDPEPFVPHFYPYGPRTDPLVE